MSFERTNYVVVKSTAEFNPDGTDGRGTLFYCGEGTWPRWTTEFREARLFSLAKHAYNSLKRVAPRYKHQVEGADVKPVSIRLEVA